MTFKPYQPDPMRAVRVAVQQSDGITINEYRHVRGRDFRRDVYAAEKRGWIIDCGGRPDRRHYEATSIGAGLVLTPKAEIKRLMRMKDRHESAFRFRYRFTMGFHDWVPPGSIP